MEKKKRYSICEKKMAEGLCPETNVFLRKIGAFLYRFPNNGHFTSFFSQSTIRNAAVCYIEHTCSIAYHILREH
jgi:hypothetical protein